MVKDKVEIKGIDMDSSQYKIDLYANNIVIFTDTENLVKQNHLLVQYSKISGAN